MGATAHEFFTDQERELYRDPDHINWLAVTAADSTSKETVMDINSVFPSNYIKCSDLQGKSVRARINRFTIEEIGKDRKGIIYFEGKQKGLVMNKTKSMILADAWGNETDNWIGREVALHPTRVPFEGKMVDSIAVEPMRSAVQQQAPAPQPPAPQPAFVDSPMPNFDSQDVPF